MPDQKKSPRSPWQALTRPETRWLVISILVLLLLTALTWVVTEPGGSGGALPQSARQATLALTPQAPATQAIAAEVVLANRNSTTGIILASLALVLIVLCGAFFGTRKKTG